MPSLKGKPYMKSENLTKAEKEYLVRLVARLKRLYARLEKFST